MKKIFTAALLLCSVISKAQTFSWNGYTPIRDFQTDTLPINVSGLPASINSAFGLSKACFNVTHTFKSNLFVKLIAPNGNTVVLVENAGGGSDNFNGTCVAMDGVPFELGSSPYTGTFLPVSDISTVNNGQNPNGLWRITITDQASSDTGHISFASIVFSANPPQGLGLGGSNTGPQGPFVRRNVVCPDGASGCDLLPDMTASALNILQSNSELPGIIKISNATPNIGYGPMEIYGIDSCFCEGQPSPCNVSCPDEHGHMTHLIRQRIYRKMPGTDTLDYYDRDAGAMTYHPEHGHLHVDDWGSFTLRMATDDPDPRNWPIIGTSVKQSYCLVNLATCVGDPGECVDNSGNPITQIRMPNDTIRWFASSCGLNQGIWPGHLDIYSQGLNEPILVEDLCNDTYYLVSITDPENKFLESDETNNWVAVPITLNLQSSTPTIKANVSQYLCGPGDSVVLKSTLSRFYQWSNGDTTQSIVVREPGTFTVNTACGTSAPFTVSYLPATAKPAVSIGIISGSNPSCSTSTYIFNATPSYGGSKPTYQWKVNDSTIQNNNTNTFYSNSLSNGDKVSCSMASSISCFSGSDSVAYSDSITIRINPINSFEAVVSQTRGYNPFCPGDTVSFTAEAVPGLDPSYQWKVDGVAAGTNSPDFTSSSLLEGQIVSCTIEARPLCGGNLSTGNTTSYNSIQRIEPAAYPTWYGNGRQQYIIRSTELSGIGMTAGPLDYISFVVGSNIGAPDTLKGYTIKMANVPNASIGTAMINPSFTNVYGPVNYAPVINDTNTHFFTTPFIWDGTSNLLVDICFSNQVVGNGNYQTLKTNTSFVSTGVYSADGPSGANACSELQVENTFTSRPLMLFSNSAKVQVTSDPITLQRQEPVYRFTGSGNWNIASNWLNGKMPPKHVLHCAEIIIDPVGNAECILNTEQIIAPGARITVVTGKKFRVIGNVLVQQ